MRTIGQEVFAILGHSSLVKSLHCWIILGTKNWKGSMNDFNCSAVQQAWSQSYKLMWPCLISMAMAIQCLLLTLNGAYKNLAPDQARPLEGASAQQYYSNSSGHFQFLSDFLSETAALYCAPTSCDHRSSNKTTSCGNKVGNFWIPFLMRYIASSICCNKRINITKQTNKLVKKQN